MQIGEDRQITIEEFFKISQLEEGTYEIETPDGWVELGELVKKSNKKCFQITTESGKYLEGSDDHHVFSKSGWKSISHLNIEEDLILTKDGWEQIVIREYTGIKDTFDFEVKHNNHSYFSNEIVSHNTGKSAFTRALAQELNMPIVVFDLSTMNNSDFANAWDTALEYAPCIALFEDIDAVFDGRKNIANTGMEQGLSFDFLLNVIDGVQNSDGVFKIVTTNNPDKIDPALGNVCNGDEMSTRPGRIDRVVHFSALDNEGKEKMAQRILGDFPREKWQHIFEKAHDDTGAQFQERCCRVALQLFWQAKNPPPVA